MIKRRVFFIKTDRKPTPSDLEALKAAFSTSKIPTKE